MTKETEWVTMINIARFNRKIVKMSTILCCSVVLTYTFLRFFSMKYQGKSLLLRAYFPYDVDVSPNYELTMLAQLVAAFYAAICYTAVDTFVATLILHICGQLSNLQRELKELRGPDEKDFNGRIMKIVEKHEYLNRLCGHFYCFWVLNLNLSNLLLLLVLKAIVFGAGYLGQSDHKGRELEKESVISEGEVTLAVGYLMGNTCLYRAACEEPHVAKEYLGAAEMIVETMKLMP
ncbi:uncharacterized protein LOC113465035, partial [Ceratina calcarata]|uniref:Uncharacterized protein LOC113465035 n=1 Tax=Ceratina calcarata TaxID=156304 RepID=A0AAJ7WF77_9HYME